MKSKKCCVLSELLHEHTLTAGPDTIMRLVPGENIVDVDIMEKIRKGNESFQLLEESYKIKVVVVDQDDDGAIKISKMSVKDARSLIEAQFDMESLESLHAQETNGDTEDGRKGVVDAIMKQIDIINAAEKVDG